MTNSEIVNLVISSPNSLTPIGLPCQSQNNLKLLIADFNSKGAAYVIEKYSGEEKAIYKFSHFKEMLSFKSGDSFGEKALLNEEARESTIETKAETELVVISKGGY